MTRAGHGQCVYMCLFFALDFPQIVVWAGKSTWKMIHHLKWCRIFWEELPGMMQAIWMMYCWAEKTTMRHLSVLVLRGFFSTVNGSKFISEYLKNPNHPSSNHQVSDIEVDSIEDKHNCSTYVWEFIELLGPWILWYSITLPLASTNVYLWLGSHIGFQRLQSSWCFMF